MMTNRQPRLYNHARHVFLATETWHKDDDDITIAIVFTNLGTWIQMEMLMFMMVLMVIDNDGYEYVDQNGHEVSSEQ